MSEENKELDVERVTNVDLKPDWFIQNVVHMATHGVEMGVTLTLGGCIVSGTLISGKKYFDAMKDQILESVEDEPTRDMMLGFIEANSSHYDKDPSDCEPKSNGYIHIKDAKLIDSSGSSVPDTGMLWRGKISQVVGITIGSII